MPPSTFFVTGTDTAVGKTLVAAALLLAASARGCRTVGLKPVAAGCDANGQNADALLLRAVMTGSRSYRQVNPVALRAAIAPHLAAAAEGRRLRVAQLAAYCRSALAAGVDFAVVEGAGGWRVPLNDRETLAQLALELRLPVILVVGMRLGCINHALLSAEAIQRDGLPLAGWVANRLDPAMPHYRANVGSLQARLPAPLLGEIPWLAEADPQRAAAQLDIAALLARRGRTD